MLLKKLKTEMHVHLKFRYEDVFKISHVDNIEKVAIYKTVREIISHQVNYAYDTILLTLQIDFIIIFSLISVL